MKKKLLSIQEHQRIIYDLLYLIDDYCQRHDIRYFLIGGTLLGAVRHQGIIPWDDDADIAMERSEYNKFISTVKKYPLPGCKVWYFGSKRGYYYPYIKILKDNTYVDHYYQFAPNVSFGINIDIFPIDGCPGNLTQARKYHVDKFNNCQIFLQQRFTWGLKMSTFKTIREKLNYLINYKIPYFRNKYIKQEFNSLEKYKISETDFCSCLAWGKYGEGEVQPISFVKDLCKLKFGSKELMAPINWDSYLKGVYGNYMELPPIDKRETHFEKTYILE